MNARYPQPSSPAKAGDPVFRDVSDETEKPRRTGYQPARGMTKPLERRSQERHEVRVGVRRDFRGSVLVLALEVDVLLGVGTALAPHGDLVHLGEARHRTAIDGQDEVAGLKTGRSRGALGKIDPKTEKITVYIPPEPMSGTAGTLDADFNGNVWVTTPDGALSSAFAVHIVSPACVSSSR